MLSGVVKTVLKIRSLVDQVVDVLAEAGPQEMPAALGEIARAQTFGKTRLLLPASSTEPAALPPPPPLLAPAPSSPPPAPRKSDPERTYSLVELKPVLGVSLWTIQEWARQGKLPTIKFNRRYRVRESALRKFLEERERIGH